MKKCEYKTLTEQNREELEEIMGDDTVVSEGFWECVRCRGYKEGCRSYMPSDIEIPVRKLNPFMSYDNRGRRDE
jgi:hypothetical protein